MLIQFTGNFSSHVKLINGLLLTTFNVFFYVFRIADNIFQVSTTNI